MRLGYSQTEFAALAGAKKGTQISWEKDASSPTAQALVAFAEAGADVLYILTGHRSETKQGQNSTTKDGEIANGASRHVGPPLHMLSDRSSVPGETVDDAKRQLGIAADEELAAVLGYDISTIRQWRAKGAISDEGRNVLYNHLIFRRRNEVARSEFSTIDASKRQFSKALVIRFLIDTTIEEDGDLEPDGLLFRAIEMDNFELAASRLLDKEMALGAKNLLAAFRKVLASDLAMRLANELTIMLNEG